MRSFPEYFKGVGKRFPGVALCFVRLRVKGTAGFICERYGRCRISSSVRGKCRKALPSTSGFGAFHRHLLHKLEQTGESLARDRHLIEYAGIKFVLQARRFVTDR